MPSIIEIVAKFINETHSGFKELGQDVDTVGKKEQETKQSTDSMGSSFGSLAKEFGFTLSLAGAVTGAFALMKSSVDAYGESEVVAAQVNAVLQSTNQIAGVTAEEVDNIATSLSRMSGQDDEAIKRGEALMLTFTKVGEDVFPKATEAALNMSMAMGTDLQSSIIQVGKAMNEPIQGATALRKVGVQLSDQQEEQIKTFMAMNDIASAQGVILQELNTEFGGVAATMGDTTVGAANKLKVAWGNMMESMGERPATGLKAIEEDAADVLNAMADATDKANDWQKAQASLGNEIQLDARNVGVYRSEIYAYAGDVERATSMGEYWEARLASTAETITTTSGALDGYIPNLEKLLDLSTSIADETERYNDKQTEVATKQADIQMQIDTLIAQGWSPLSDKVKDLQQDYDDLGMKSTELADKHAEAMGRMQYDLLITKLSADGFTASEYAIAQQAGIMFGVFDQESVDAAKNFDLVSEAVAQGKIKVEDMGKALELLPKLKNIDVVINAIANIPGALSGSNPQAQPGGYGYQGAGYAEGGITTGPDSGHFELLHGTEAVIPLQNGGIPVQLSGNGQQSSGGNNIQVVLQIQSPITILDQQQGQEALLSYVEYGVKALQDRGVLPRD